MQAAQTPRPSRKHLRRARKKARRAAAKHGAPNVTVKIDGVERAFYRDGCGMDGELKAQYGAQHPAVRFFDTSKTLFALGCADWPKNAVGVAEYRPNDPSSLAFFAAHNHRRYVRGSKNVFPDVYIQCPATGVCKFVSSRDLAADPFFFAQICDGVRTPIMCCAKCLGTEATRGWEKRGFDWVCHKCA